MKDALLEIERLRTEAKRLRRLPYTEKEIRILLQDCIGTLKPLLPKASYVKAKKGWKYTFGIQEIGVVTVEPVHGSREAIPVGIRSKQTRAILTLLDIVEEDLPEEDDSK